MPERGVIDYDQIRQTARTGDGAKLATSAGTLTPGNLQRADAHGNIEDAGVSVDTDASLAANSDAKIASQKATKAYVDAHAGGSATPCPTPARCRRSAGPAATQGSRARPAEQAQTTRTQARPAPRVRRAT